MDPWSLRNVFCGMRVTPLRGGRGGRATQAPSRRGNPSLTHALPRRAGRLFRRLGKLTPRLRDKHQGTRIADRKLRQPGSSRDCHAGDSATRAHRLYYLPPLFLVTAPARHDAVIEFHTGLPAPQLPNFKTRGCLARHVEAVAVAVRGEEN